MMPTNSSQCSRYLICAFGLLLAFLAACSPAPSLPATSAPQPTTQAAAPTAAAQPTALPPTALPPTALPPTAVPATPAEAPTSPVVDSGAASSLGYLIYQRADGSLWRADGGGAAPINLADPTEPSALLPWAASPDGKTIALVAGRGVWFKFEGSPSLALWLVGADGTNPRKIQDLLPPRGVDLTPGGEEAFNLIPALTVQQKLAWSPDGQVLAFA
ncbi:MAG TPA: hypothetical protein VFU22_00450, partial [Roseiflexaceae bacterium]|nr:hypothetical protein [Roseiflexaceae bacterium]